MLGGIFLFCFCNAISWAINRILIYQRFPDIAIMGIDWFASLAWVVISLPLLWALGRSAWHYRGWIGWSMAALCLLLAALITIGLTIEELIASYDLAIEAWKVLLPNRY